MGAWMVAAGAVASDVLQLDGKNDRVFCCGNFGMMVINTAERATVDVVKTLRRMAGATAARGGQSGGLVTLLPDGSSYRCRYVPSKREDLARSLVNRFRLGLCLRKVWAWVRGVLCCWCSPVSARKNADGEDSRLDCALYVGHTRFATSSAPTMSESHPHRFGGQRWYRVWRKVDGGWTSAVERFEMFVTHNGDFDFLTVLGRLRTQEDVGLWLCNVLHVRGRVAQCDSVKIGGVLELLRTKGLWLPSLRLAYQHAVQPSFEATVTVDPSEVSPTHSGLEQAAAVADRTFAEFTKGGTLADSPEEMEQLRAALAEALVKDGSELAKACGDCRAVAKLAVKYFLRNDLFTAMKELLDEAHGSFGISACCTVDPQVVVLASRGQAMSVAFNEEKGVVLWGSEASAQAVSFGREEEKPTKSALAGGGLEFSEHGWFGASVHGFVQGGNAQAAQRVDPEAGRALSEAADFKCTHRHDLDENGGEVIELMAVRDAAERERATDGEPLLLGERFQPLAKLHQLSLRVYMCKQQKFLGPAEFLGGGNLVGLLGNAYVDELPVLKPGTDRVAADISHIPMTLTRIRREWRKAESSVRQTAEALFQALQEKALEVHSNKCGRLEIDVLVTAVEASLWIGEQFASDLQTLFPKLRVVPLSANKIVGVVSNFQGSDAMTGFSFCSKTMALKNTIVVAISHSGQTFPTLHATHTLRHLCGDKIFVVSGSIDCKMAAAVGQAAHASAPWISRVFPTYAGWRPSEALTVSTVALHHTFSELLLFLAERAQQAEASFRHAAGFVLSEADVSEIARLHKWMVYKTSVETVGYKRDGTKVESEITKGLVRQGRQWALHVLEGPYVWCLSCAYICATVLTARPVFTAVKIAIWGEEQHKYDEQLKMAALALDCVLYCFLPLVFSVLLRLVQGRQLWARLGKRSLVIGDVPYVHQLLESYVSKLFSLSYSIASIDVHGANPVDHLLHRFTHRIARGVLIACGRPDGRLFSQTKTESWILLALQQAKAVVHLLTPPEIVTVGHNPYSKASVVDGQVTLSQMRPKFICEVLDDVKSHDPMARLAGFKRATSVCDENLDATIWSHFDRDDFDDENAGMPLGSYLLAQADSETKREYSLLQKMAIAGGGYFMGINANPGPMSNALQDVDGEDANGVAAAADAPGNRDASMQSSRVVSVRRTATGDSGHTRRGSLDLDEHKEGRRLQQQVGALRRGGRTAEGGGGSFRRGASSNEKQAKVPVSLKAMFGGLEVSHRKKDDDSWHSSSEHVRAEIMDAVGLELGEASKSLASVMAEKKQQHSTLANVLNHCTTMESWYENRYASLERYMGMLVMFHAMADRVASFYPLRFDVSRSQSQLRIATTAAPISAAEIQHEWAEHIHRSPLMSATTMSDKVASLDNTSHSQSHWTLSPKTRLVGPPVSSGLRNNSVGSVPSMMSQDATKQGGIATGWHRSGSGALAGGEAEGGGVGFGDFTPSDRTASRSPLTLTADEKRNSADEKQSAADNAVEISSSDAAASSAPRFLPRMAPHPGGPNAHYSATATLAVTLTPAQNHVRGSDLC